MVTIYSMTQISFKGISTLKIDNKGRIVLPSKNIFSSFTKPKSLDFFLDVDSSFGSDQQCLHYSLTKQSIISFPLTSKLERVGYRIQIPSTYINKIANLRVTKTTYFIGLDSSFLIANEEIGQKIIFTLSSKNLINNIYQKASND